MIFVWLYLLVSMVIFILGVYYQVRYLRGDRGAGFAKGRQAPVWLWPLIICFGLLGVLSAVPGAIFHRPGWLIDQFYRVISRL